MNKLQARVLYLMVHVLFFEIWLWGAVNNWHVHDFILANFYVIWLAWLLCLPFALTDWGKD